jgi:hypothetical protein
MVMISNRHFNLFCFSWVLTLIAYILMYGGFHPEPVCRSFIKYYGQTLIVFANLPSLFYALLYWNKNKKNSIDVFVIIASAMLQFFILK